MSRGGLSKMSIKKLAFVSMAGLMLGGVPFVSVAQVASANEVSAVKSDAVTPVSDSLVSRIDDYVVVKGNQYVLELSDKAKTLFTSEEIASVQSNLSKANANVKNNALEIDAETKTTESAPQIMTYARYNKHATFKNFWWGTRYYFTSNAAVNEFCWQLNNVAIGAGAAGMLGGAIGAGIGTVVGSYFAKMSNDLNYYNQMHSHNQIYMDVNFALIYSCHILR